MSRVDITVGISVSLSGRFHLLGQQALQGLLLWQSYINSQGGVAVRNADRRPVRLIWYNDRSQVKCARENLFRLLREDQIDILLGPCSSSLAMAVVEIAEEYKKVLWNHGGSSDEIFGHGRRYLVGITSPASEYLRAFPRWLAEQCPTLTRICVLYSGKGTFAWRVARGILESALAVSHHSVHLVPINVPWDNPETVLASDNFLPAPSPAAGRGRAYIGPAVVYLGILRASKIQIDLEVPEDFGRLPQELETAVFRTVQECLTNIHRHSESPVARVRLTRTDNETRLKVEDGGTGIPTDKLDEISSAGTPGVGIRGMGERLKGNLPAV